MQTRKDNKTERRDRTYGALEAFQEFLDTFTPPRESFDPRGAWKQTYAIRLFAEISGTVGFLELRRRPAGDAAELSVATVVDQSNGRQEQTARLISATGGLGALRSLDLESISSDPEGKPVEATRGSVRCAVRGDAIEFTRAGRKRRTPVTPPVVANWALFDALQRLPSTETKPFEFTLLDDGDLVKPAHKLTYRGKESARVADGASLSLDCWEQTGYGVLPIHYWLEGNGRLLFAIAGQKAFLYDPAARGHMAARKRRKA